MSIKIGDRLPETKFRIMTPEGPAWNSTSDIFRGKKVVLFAVPGAFTSTCNNMHLPGYLQNLDAIKAKGVDTVAVTGVNDMFVMEAWKRATGADGKIEFLAWGCAPGAIPCWWRMASSNASTSRRRPARSRSRARTRC